MSIFVYRQLILLPVCVKDPHGGANESLIFKQFLEEKKLSKIVQCKRFVHRFRSGRRNVCRPLGRVHRVRQCRRKFLSRLSESRQATVQVRHPVQRALSRRHQRSRAILRVRVCRLNDKPQTTCASIIVLNFFFTEKIHTDVGERI